MLLEASASWSQARYTRFRKLRGPSEINQAFRPISDVAWKLIARLAAQLFQLIKTKRALSDVGKEVRRLNLRGAIRKFQ